MGLVIRPGFAKQIIEKCFYQRWVPRAILHDREHRDPQHAIDVLDRCELQYQGPWGCRTPKYGLKGMGSHLFGQSFHE
jgi:hypothetical protein